MLTLSREIAQTRKGSIDDFCDQLERKMDRCRRYKRSAIDSHRAAMEALARVARFVEMNKTTAPNDTVIPGIKKLLRQVSICQSGILTALEELPS